MSAAVRVLHIEPRQFWRDYVANLVGSFPDLIHVGSAATAVDASECCSRLSPQVVLMDVYLPDGDGFKLAKHLGCLPQAPAIVFLTEREDEVTLHRVERSNARALVWKIAGFERYVPVALSEAAMGRRYFPPEVHDQLRRLRASPNAFFKILSDCEQNLIGLLCSGYSYREIALKEGCCEGTVRVHFHRIMVKVGLHRRAELTCWAQKTGFSADPFGRTK